MREIKVGQVWCLNGCKQFKSTVIFVTQENVLIKDLDGEEALVDKKWFVSEYTFLKNIRL